MMLVNPYILGSSFSPLNISGCLLWLDASQIVGLVDTDPVATWSDLSGNGNDATQSTSNKKPAYRTNRINGLPMVVGDGNDILATALDRGSGDGTVFIVGKWDTPSSTSRIAGFAQSSSFTNHLGGWGYYVNTAPTVGSLYYNGLGDATVSSIACYKKASDEVTIYAGGTSLAGTSLSANWTPAFYVFGDHAGEESVSSIAEIIIYDTALGTTDREAVEDYLTGKYAL